MQFWGEAKDYVFIFSIYKKFQSSWLFFSDDFISTTTFIQIKVIQICVRFFFTVFKKHQMLFFYCYYLGGIMLCSRLKKDNLGWCFRQCFHLLKEQSILLFHLFITGCLQLSTKNSVFKVSFVFQYFSLNLWKQIFKHVGNFSNLCTKCLFVFLILEYCVNYVDYVENCEGEKCVCFFFFFNKSSAGGHWLLLGLEKLLVRA